MKGARICILSTLFLFSCGTNSRVEVETEYLCEHLTYGTFEGETKDGIKVTLIRDYDFQVCGSILT